MTFDFVYVGRIDVRQKRCDLLVDFFKLLLANEIECSLTIFGEGDEALERQLTSIGGDLMGFVEDWWKYLNKDSVFLSFSDYEGCPLALLEFYKHVGKKIIVLNRNGLKQYVSANCVYDTLDDMVAQVKTGMIPETSFPLRLYSEPYDYERCLEDLFQFLDNV